MIKPTNNIFFAINSTDFKIESRDLILNLDTFVKKIVVVMYSVSHLK